MSAELALGTVQFGLAYGIAGRGEAVPAMEARSILECAWDNGIRMLDTAPVYGDIEPRLAALVGGHEFSIVSKIPALPPGSLAHEVDGLIASSIAQSKQRLGSRLSALLFHRGADLTGEHGERAFAAAQRAVAGDSIRLGASCYSPDEAIGIRSRVPVELLQLPGNALDQRLAGPRAVSQLSHLELHLRSVFLQGLLLMPIDEATRRVPGSAAALQAWSRFCRERGVTPLRAALGVARALPGVRYCVVGVDRVAQLEEICAAWRDATPIEEAGLGCADEDVIDPRRWKAA